MIVLGIETATAVCAVALVDDDVVRAERRYEIPQAHSEKLMECVDDCLKSAGLVLSSIDGIAVSIGPGSFTGLRIGLSVAKGLAFAADKPLIGVPTLEALAVQPVRKGVAETDDVIVPMIDARRDEVYIALFRRHEKNVEQMLPSQAVRCAEAISILSGHRRVILVGDGADKFYHYYSQSELNNNLRVLQPDRDLQSCSAIDVAGRGVLKFRNGDRDNMNTLEPMYIKDFYTTAKPQQFSVES
ncbi:MAG TPA: tRNA (adenosine(37)-N6)-threonylcarbamoyltransferase complex dimerization subunit type 1 TsaB [Bacteroidota bacterium]|nr:tRNA (adenosine(37)-N6)-threonylcarbamoyltransferase complex dimerization subunit type 1 TsaB [Bacteroidota bacterium]